MILIDETYDIDYSNKIYQFIEKFTNSEDGFLLHSSGSTGQKKAFFASKSQIIASAHATIKALELTHKDMALLCLNIDFIAAKMLIIRALETKMGLVIATPNVDLVSILDKYPISFASFVPLQIHKIVAQSGLETINKIKTILIGGAAISQDLKLKLHTSTSAIYQTFGMTETVSHIALRKISGEDTQKYYKLLPNIEIRANNQNCLCIKGIVTQNVWVETTDVVQIIDNQTFEWLGRNDFVINSAGIKMHPEEIEAKLELFFDFTFLISYLDDNLFGHKIVLVIEQVDRLFDEVKIKQVFINNLSKYESPKKILYLAKFPLLENGKIDRLAIKKIINDYNL